MKAIIIGATGATGKELVQRLINDQTFNQITVLVRKKSFENHPKLKEVIVNFEHLDQFKHEIYADVAFSCLGTTLKIAGSKANQWKVDFDYQLQFAQLAKENHIKTFVLLSAFGANSASKIFYSKMKGKLEEQIVKLNFPQTIIVKPASLIRPNSNRPFEKFSVKLIQQLNKFGILKNFTPISVFDLSYILLQSVKNFKSKIVFLQMPEILKITTAKKS